MFGGLWRHRYLPAGWLRRQRFVREGEARAPAALCLVSGAVTLRPSEAECLHTGTQEWGFRLQYIGESLYWAGGDDWGEDVLGPPPPSRLFTPT